MMRASPDTRLLTLSSAVANCPKYLVYRAAVDTYYDDTIDAGDVGTNDTWLGLVFGGVGNARYISSTVQFNSVEVSVAIAYVAVHTLTWEYWNGSAWTALSSVVDTTSQFTVLGAGTIRFALPTDWAQTNVNSLGPYYWVRCRTSAYTSQTTLAIGDYVRTLRLLGDDDSQRVTHLTKSGAGAYEDPSPRCAIDGTGAGRTIEVACQLFDAHADEMLIIHGGDVATYWAIFCVDDIVYFNRTGGTVTTMVAPNISATPSDYVIAWATEPNPATTGASNALISTFTIYDVANDVVLWESVAHAVYTADDAGALAIGGSWDGGALVTPFSQSIAAARISARVHSRRETIEHFVAQTSAPTIIGVTAVEDAVVPSEIVESTSLAGPQYQAAAAAMATGRNRHRAISPVVQLLFRDYPTLEDDLASDYPATWVIDLGSGYQASLAWAWLLRVPRHCSRLRVGVQWATWDTDASGTPDVVDLRVHTSGQAPGELAATTSVQGITRSADDNVDGTGVLESFALINVERDEDGLTWVYFSARVDAGSGSGNVAYMVREATACPVAASAGVDEQPNGWNP